MVRVLALVLAGVLALPAVAQDKGYSAFVAKAKAALTRDFKDPMAAQYRNLAVYRSINGKDIVLCGEVNAKNSYGAYVGFAPFYADENSATLKSGPDDTLFETLRRGSCDKRIAAAS